MIVVICLLFIIFVLSGFKIDNKVETEEYLLENEFNYDEDDNGKSVKYTKHSYIQSKRKKV